MENNAEFFNMYVENLLSEISELNKTKMILQTQISWKDKEIQRMTEFQNKLQNANNDLLAKLKEYSLAQEAKVDGSKTRKK